MTQTLARTPEAVDSKNYLDSAKVLSECCTQKTVCRFELIHNGYSTSATLMKLHPQGVELRISADDANEPMIEQAICSISFSVGPTICAFLGHLLDVRVLSSHERKAFVTVPGLLFATNLRRSFRVPVIMDSGLETRVWTADGVKHWVTACDMAESGIEIEFESGKVPELKVGGKLEIELRFRNENVKRTAEIRRIAGPRCGLSFGSNVEEIDREQAARLSRFVISLQQIWLKNRIR